MIEKVYYYIHAFPKDIYGRQLGFVLLYSILEPHTKNTRKKVCEEKGMNI